MSDPPPLSHVPETVITDPYVPFPSFTEWAASVPEQTTFDQFAREFATAREAITPSVLGDAVRVATNWAAIDTGAIEGLYDVDRGFTYSVAVSAAMWEDIHRLKGEAVARSISDAIAAYDFVLDCATRTHPITEVWIRELHEIVARSQDKYSVITAVGPQLHDLEKGVYKTQPNSPLNLTTSRIHSYAPPLDTPAEMSRLVDELRSADFGRAHPVLQAAYAHYAFVCIHPFADGNGRVARSLASVYLYRNPGVPLVIFSDQKGDYISALEAADQGNHAPFARFVAERVIDTMSMVRAQLSVSQVPDVATQFKQMAPILRGASGLAHTEIDAIGARLLDVFTAAAKKKMADVGLEAPLTGAVGAAAITAKALPAGYRLLPGGAAVQIIVASSPPGEGRVGRTFSVAIARPGTIGADFKLFSPASDAIDVALREMHPIVTQALTFRIEAEVEREIRQLVRAVIDQAEASLRTKGYLE